LRIVAVGLAKPTGKAEASAAPALAAVVKVSDDVRTVLALFRSHADGGETELMLDRGAGVRARWTTSGPGGLPESAALIADAVRVASIPVAAANHAGHAH
jgi:hypothetical protein